MSDKIMFKTIPPSTDVCESCFPLCNFGGFVVVVVVVVFVVSLCFLTTFKNLGNTRTAN